MWSGAWLPKLDLRIAERLPAEAVDRAVGGAVVLPQADVEPVVGLVGGAGDHVDDRHRLALANGDEDVELGRLGALQQRHVRLAPCRPAGRALAGRQLDEQGQARLRMDAHRGDEALEQLVRRPALGTERERLGTWRIARHVLPGPLLLRAQQLGDSAGLCREKGFEALGLHRNDGAQLGHRRERRPGAERMVAPRAGRMADHGDRDHQGDPAASQGRRDRPVRCIDRW
jgi:hypothetical protein